MFGLLCKLLNCDKVDPIAVTRMDEANAELLVAAKNVVRVAPYKTMATMALIDSIARVEGAIEQCRQK